jgi:DNA-binding PadR family transcriptional regulator
MKNIKVQVKLTRSLLDLIVLQLLSTQPMHGYQIITQIRKTFGVYFGPSTIYPLMKMLEGKGYVKGGWNMDSGKPRKVYKLTAEGQNILNFIEDSLNLICRKMLKNGLTEEENHPQRLSIQPSPKNAFKLRQTKTFYLLPIKPHC